MMEDIARGNGVVPATIGVVRGKIIVGMSESQINEMLEDEPLKIGTREIPYAVALKKSAATTVSATMRIAKLVGIDVFATGGIGVCIWEIGMSLKISQRWQRAM